MKVCRYCDNDSIGYKKDSYDGDYGVCRDCAHINSTVFLWNGDTWFKTPKGIDPQSYRGPVEIDQCYIPTHEANGKRYDSVDGVTVDGPVRGKLVDYYGDQDAGDNVLVNLEDGRSYWFRWDGSRIKKAMNVA